jgi:YHS domain-containing protein
MTARDQSSRKNPITARSMLIAASLAFGAMGFVGSTVFGTSFAQAMEPAIYTGIVKGVAAGGYDPVAYFTEKKPVAGKADITLEHEGTTWRFSTLANRDAFKADPAKFAPQYGGYCAWAVSQGYTAKGDPQVWSITGGKLYLNYNKSVQSGWEKDVPGLVKKADANWPKVLGK